MTPEGRVKEWVKTLLDSYKAAGLWYFMPVQGGWGKQGIPDFIISFRGRFIAVETKAANGVLTSLQGLQLSLLKGSGALILVVRDEKSLETLAAHLRMMETFETPAY